MVLAAALLALAAPSQAFLTFSAPGFVEDVVAENLPFAVGMTFAPDGRLFIALQSGIIRVYQNGALLPTPFIDISDQVSDFGDRGLLGIAVHPGFPSQPYVYLLFTWNPPGYEEWGGKVSRLIRVTADAAQEYNVATAGSEQTQTTPGGPGHVILAGTNSTLANIGNPDNNLDMTKASCMTGRTMNGTPIEDCLPSDSSTHSIGTVRFGLDGSLFFGSGDGADYVAVDRRALRSQMLNSMGGKIFRIDPDTGLGLLGNPSFDPGCPQCNRSKVYSLGLRNPFRFTIHPTTGEPFIGDVGWSTWEEINTGKGANFGWPCYEGGTAGSPPPTEGGATTSLRQPSYEINPGTQATCSALYAQGLSGVRAPVFTYDHTGPDGAGGTGGAAANAGAFYGGTAYPAQFESALFIADYSRQWIRYLTFNAQGQATVHNFAQESSAAPVQILPGPDSNLYVVMLTETGNSRVVRIRYVSGGNTPPTAVASAAPTIGTAPLVVDFSSVGSFDPDAQPLAYDWDFGDGASSSAPNPSHEYAASGVYTAKLTVAETTAPFASGSNEVVITVGNEPPLATITAPTDGTTYEIGDVIPYSGFATSGGVPIDPSQLSWTLRLHHNQHLHFTQLGPGASGSLNVAEHGDDTYQDICLTATVPPSLSDTQCVTLLPKLTQITLATAPPGLLVNYDDEGITQASPLIVESVVGSEQSVSVPLVQGGMTFTGWSDGEPSNVHPFVVGLTPATYTAEYVNLPPVAVATALPLTGTAPLAVSFTGSASSDPEFATLVHSWAFGDGNGSTAADPQHTYTVPGTYQATLTVTDQRDGSSSQSVTIVVSAACNDGVDNDGDGRIDGADPGCRDPLYTTESPQCQNGLNDDGQTGIDFDGGDSLDISPRDGLIDAAFNPGQPAVGAADPQCAYPWKMKETASCGLGFEIAFALAPLAALRRRRQVAR